MELSKFTLDLINVKKIPLDKYEYDFTFIVDGKQYLTNRFFADILSPVIAHYHYQDKTINTFTITTEQKTDYFESFLNLCKFEEERIDQAHIKYYSECFLQLGNIDEYLKLQNQISDEITTTNVVDRLKILASILRQNRFNISNTNEQVSKLIKYSSEHFYQLDKEKLSELDDYLLEDIIRHEKLQIEDENSLLQFVLELYQKDKKYAILFEYVYFENVNDEKILEEFFHVFEIEHISKGIWTSLFYRFLISKKRFISKERYKNSMEQENEIITILKENDRNDEFKGIMRYLTDKAGGNIHDKGVIEITSNSYQCDGNHPKNLVDYQSINNMYASKDQKDGHICFDFKDKQIQISSYLIQSCCNRWNNNHFRNWVVEGSNDNQKWEIIDEHSNDSKLNGFDNKVAFYTKQENNFYRYIRIRQTGVSWQNNYWIYFPFLEFYGKLKLPK